jgi:hypothetical protein
MEVWELGSWFSNPPQGHLIRSAQLHEGVRNGGTICGSDNVQPRAGLFLDISNTQHRPGRGVFARKTLAL